MNRFPERRLQIPAQADAHEARVMPESKQAADEGPDGMTVLHVLPVSAQANAHEARVMPEPKQAADEGPNGMKAFHTFPVSPAGVSPAQAGIQTASALGSRLRGSDLLERSFSSGCRA